MVPLRKEVLKHGTPKPRYSTLNLEPGGSRASELRVLRVWGLGLEGLGLFRCQTERTRLDRAKTLNPTEGPLSNPKGTKDIYNNCRYMKYSQYFYRLFSGKV